jgi:hypothetical protein
MMKNSFEIFLHNSEEKRKIKLLSTMIIPYDENLYCICGTESFFVLIICDGNPS